MPAIYIAPPVWLVSPLFLFHFHTSPTFLFLFLSLLLLNFSAFPLKPTSNITKMVATDKLFTLSQASEHNTPKDCWLIIHGKKLTDFKGFDI
ncbi:hypothetical protein Patl1_25973 [Pistacia atlantica]|uniref:Uncharacterized protein n=1 Tax=Pistacia atlantica TaxID=434234 RepID=A0ACC1B3A0_9ROSI|nr:hypothetical protein Patl1_25973 [Pistacia atlantica]